MKLNKVAVTETVIDKIAGSIRPCIKLGLDNIVFPKWSDLGLLGMIFSQKIKTKEQPTGCDYDEATYQVVMRVINGKVLMTGGRPDAYTWKHSKVTPYLDDPSKIRLIGTNSATAVLNLSEVMSTIENQEEKLILADMFCSLNKDLLLVSTESENRLCAEVTKELYDAGLTACVDTWMQTDENGDADATLLNIGDFLIINTDFTEVYCIRRDVFLETHSLVSY